MIDFILPSLMYRLCECNGKTHTYILNGVLKLVLVLCTFVSTAILEAITRPPVFSADWPL